MCEILDEIGEYYRIKFSRLKKRIEEASGFESYILFHVLKMISIVHCDFLCFMSFLSSDKCGNV